jgi:hypothetical protein
VSNNPPHK